MKSVSIEINSKTGKTLFIIDNEIIEINNFTAGTDGNEVLTFVRNFNEYEIKHLTKKLINVVL